MLNSRGNTMRKLVGLLLLGLAPVAWIAAAEPQGAAPAVVVIKDATILTVSHGNIPKGSILIRDGKIAEVGPNVAVPQGATVIDAAGMYVMPGIVDPHNHIGISGGVNEGSLAVTSMVSIEDVIDPTDINIYRDLAGGVTTTHTLHGSANPIGGRNAVIKLRWGKDAKGLLFQGAKPTLKFALGENVKRSTGTPPRYPSTRMGTADVIRDAFIRAREYIKQWDEYKKRSAAGDKTAVVPRRDLELEAIAEVLRGERLAFVHTYRADETLMALHLADEFGFKIRSFIHVLEGYKVAKEIAAHGAVGSTFSDWWAYKVEAYDAIPYNAAIMLRKGVLVTLNSDSAEEARHLNQEAAKCMKYGGLTEQEALALITINPAKELMIDSRVGSIDPGKDADLAIFNHHPLSIYATVQKVLIDGEVYFDVQKDLEMRKRMEAERKALEARDRKAGGPPTDRRRPGAAAPDASVSAPQIH